MRGGPSALKGAPSPPGRCALADRGGWLEFDAPGRFRAVEALPRTKRCLRAGGRAGNHSQFAPNQCAGRAPAPARAHRVIFATVATVAKRTRRARRARVRAHAQKEHGRRAVKNAFYGIFRVFDIVPCPMPRKSIVGSFLWRFPAFLRFRLPCFACLCWKSCVRLITDRGFESLSLRHNLTPRGFLAGLFVIRLPERPNRPLASGCPGDYRYSK